MTINQFDNGIMHAIQHWPKWWRPLLRAVSQIGLPMVVGTMAVATVFLTWEAGQTRWAWAFALTLAALIINAIMKQFLHRTRPDTLYVRKMRSKSYSFPSGHALGTVVFFGLLSAMAGVFLPVLLARQIAVGLMVLVLVIGISRVYLGAHFPTDVLGGWIFGTFGLWIILLAVRP